MENYKVIGGHKWSFNEDKELQINGVSVSENDIVAIGTSDMSEDELQFVIRTEGGWVLPIDLEEALTLVAFKKGCTAEGAKDWLLSDGLKCYDTLWDVANTISRV